MMLSGVLLDDLGSGDPVEDLKLSSLKLLGDNLSLNSLESDEAHSEERIKSMPNESCFLVDKSIFGLFLWLLLVWKAD